MMVMVVVVAAAWWVKRINRTVVDVRKRRTRHNTIKQVFYFVLPV